MYDITYTHKINNYYVGADPGFDQEGGGCPDQGWIY